MRLLLVLKSPFTGIGGIQRVEQLLCKACLLLAQQHRLQVCILSLEDQDDRIKRVSFTYHRNVSFYGGGGNINRFAMEAFNTILRDRPDWVIFSHVNLSRLGLVMRLAKPGLRYAVVAHGVEVWSRLPWLKRVAMQAACKILAVSRYTRDQLSASNGIPLERILLFPNAIDLAEWSCGPQDTTVQESVKNRRLLLTTARLDAREQYKGVDTVIQSLSRIIQVEPCVHYIVVGDGDDLPRLQQMARDWQVADHVTFLGGVSIEKLRAYLQACDIFVMPSKGEGFGIAFLEAMAFKKPVIGGQHGGTLDVIVDGETGFLVEYGDVEALTERILRLLQDDDLRVKMGEQGYHRLLKNYTLEQFTDRLAQFLEV